jgi:hypothetical protein
MDELMCGGAIKEILAEKGAVARTRGHLQNSAVESSGKTDRLLESRRRKP